MNWLQVVIGAGITASVVSSLFQLVGTYLIHHLTRKRDREAYLRDRVRARQERLAAAYTAMIGMGETFGRVTAERAIEKQRHGEMPPEVRQATHSDQLADLHEKEVSLAAAEHTIILEEDDTAIRSQFAEMYYQFSSACLTLRQTEYNPTFTNEGEGVLTMWLNNLKPSYVKLTEALRVKMDAFHSTSNKQLLPPPH